MNTRRHPERPDGRPGESPGPSGTRTGTRRRSPRRPTSSRRRFCGRPRRALDLLDPKQLDLLPDLRRVPRAPIRENDPVMLFGRFGPEEARLAGDVIKVRGHMTAAAGRPGEVKVHADCTFVYPMVRADADAAGVDAGEPVQRTIVSRDIALLRSAPGTGTSPRAA